MSVDLKEVYIWSYVETTHVEPSEPPPEEDASETVLIPEHLYILYWQYKSAFEATANEIAKFAKNGHRVY